MLCDVALKTATEPFSKIELQRTEKALVLGVRSVRITGIDLENLVWLLMLRNKYLKRMRQASTPDKVAEAKVVSGKGCI